MEGPYLVHLKRKAFMADDVSVSGREDGISVTLSAIDEPPKYASGHILPHAVISGQHNCLNYGPCVVMNSPHHDFAFLAESGRSRSRKI